MTAAERRRRPALGRGLAELVVPMPEKPAERPPLVCEGVVADEPCYELHPKHHVKRGKAWLHLCEWCRLATAHNGHKGGA
jgi:hypothetical protein